MDQNQLERGNEIKTQIQSLKAQLPGLSLTASAETRRMMFSMEGKQDKDNFWSNAAPGNVKNILGNGVVENIFETTRILFLNAINSKIAELEKEFNSL